MMTWIRRLLVVVVWTCSLGLAYGRRIESGEARELLDKALLFSTVTPFSSVKRSKNSEGAVVERQYYSNGSLLVSRYPSWIQDKGKRREHISWKMSDQANSTRWQWYVEKDAILKERVLEIRNFYTVIPWECAQGCLEDPHFDTASFDLAMEKFNGVSCKKLTVTFGTDDETMIGASVRRFDGNRIENAFRFSKDFIHEHITPKKMKSDERLIREAYLASIVFFIDSDEKRPFIHRCVSYDGIEGQIYHDFDFGKVSYEPESIPEDVFSLPPECRIKVCRSYDEYATEVIDLLHGLPWWQKIRAICYVVVIAQVILAWLKVPIHFLLVVTAVCFAIALFLKFRSARRPKEGQG